MSHHYHTSYYSLSFDASWVEGKIIAPHYRLYWFDFYRIKIMIFKTQWLFTAIERELKFRSDVHWYPHLIRIDGNLIACTNWLNFTTLVTHSGPRRKRGRQWRVAHRFSINICAHCVVDMKNFCSVVITHPSICDVRRKINEAKFIRLSHSFFFYSAQPQSFRNSFEAFLFFFVSFSDRSCFQLRQHFNFFFLGSKKNFSMSTSWVILLRWALTKRNVSNLISWVLAT